MLAKPIDALSQPDIEALLGVSEGRTIEFKQRMPAKTRDEKVDLVAAVSSFANTAGGELIIGVQATRGIAKQVVGVPLDDADAEKLRLEQLMADCIEPKVPRIHLGMIEAGEGRYVIVIRVPKSWLAPHRVTIDNKFYGRNSSGRFPMNVLELRTAFLASATAIENMRKFRDQRLTRIMAKDTPLPLRPGTKLVLHVLPVPSFASGLVIDVVDLIARGSVMPVPPGREGHPNNYGVNLDGLMNYTVAPGQVAGAYAQIFRSGAIEGVDVQSNDGKNISYIASGTFEVTILKAVRNYFKVLDDLDMGYPRAVFVSYCDASACRFRSPSQIGGAYDERGPLNQSVILLPECLISDEGEDLATALRLTFNALWNGFGFIRSDKYSEDGKWMGR